MYGKQSRKMTTLIPALQKCAPDIDTNRSRECQIQYIDAVMIKLGFMDSNIGGFSQYINILEAFMCSEIRIT